MSDTQVDHDILDIAARLHWYALTVPAQKEFVAQKILRRYGLRTFVPLRREYRHASAKAKRTRQPKQEFCFPLAPRYLFAGFTPGRPLWFDLFSLPCISGVVGIDGRPMPIVRKDMTRLVRKTATGINAPEAQKFMRTHHEFSVGDVVRVMDGPFEGLSVPVVEITGGLARLCLSLFGGAVDGVEVRLDWLEAA
ncbi:transcription termination/antitermination protein NusG [Fulvimarina manganoxydans]|nr:transcription termination/antitermination NusG family protein [Fulvimarina manganoxydans]